MVDYIIAHSKGRLADYIAVTVAERARQEGQNISFKMLREFFPAETYEPLNSPQITNHAGLDIIGDPDAVIWVPSPVDPDWFRRLNAEGYHNKRILLNIGFSNARELFPGATHFVELYQQRDDTGEYDLTKAVDRLYNIIRN